MPKKAFGRFKVKSFDEDEWEFEGVASSIEMDLHGDIVVPSGGEFSLPTPFLFQHSSEDPIGNITEIKIIGNKIKVKGYVQKPTDDMPPAMTARLQEAWSSMKTKLMRGLSIGFRALEFEKIESGYKYLKWRLLEISLCTIPANQNGNVTVVRSIFSKNLNKNPAVAEKSPVAVAKKSNGVSFSLKPKGKNMKYAEIIKRLKATIAELREKMAAIQQKSIEEERSKNADERAEFDDAQVQIKELELEIKDLETLQSESIEKAVPVAKSIKSDTKDFSGVAFHEAPEKLDKGIALARFAMAVGAAKGDIPQAERIAKRAFDKDKRLHHIMKAAVDGGSTTDLNWAAKLSEYQEISTDFVEFLRPQTLIGKFGQNGVPALRGLPFNVNIKSQTAGGTAGWVGQGKHKPLTKQAFDSVNLGFTKLAAITVASEELLRFSNPSAEALIRDDLAAAVKQVMDADFIGKTNAGEAGVQPASVTYGLTCANGTGDPEADILSLWTSAINANFDLSGAVYITTPAVAMKLAGLKTVADNRRFPNVTIHGGNIDGVPLLTSSHVDSNLFILAFANEIWLADDGVVTIDASREASLIMDTAPQTVFDGAKAKDATAEDVAASIPVSMFQTNQVAIRAERYVNWLKRRAGAVVCVDTSKNDGWS